MFQTKQRSLTKKKDYMERISTEFPVPPVCESLPDRISCKQQKFDSKVDSKLKNTKNDAIIGRKNADKNVRRDDKSSSTVTWRGK